MAQKEKQKKSSYFELTVVNYKTFRCYTCGSCYCHKGAASNYLWLPETPQWGIVWGLMRKYLLRNEGNADHQDDPCSACESKTGTNSVMIPARTVCYDG